MRVYKIKEMRKVVKNKAIDKQRLKGFDHISKFESTTPITGALTRTTTISNTTI